MKTENPGVFGKCEKCANKSHCATYDLLFMQCTLDGVAIYMDILSCRQFECEDDSR